MLRAFQRQLNLLTRDPDKNFEEHLRQRWDGNPVPESLVKDLKEFVRILPKIERRIYYLYAWLPEGSRVKSVGSHFLTYMYQPDDFIPENEKNGLFGYLDDAYIAALFYELMLEEIIESKDYRLRVQDVELLKKVIKLRKKAKAFIPEEAIQIKEMIAGLFEGDDSVYQGLFRDKIPA